MFRPPYGCRVVSSRPQFWISNYGAAAVNLCSVLLCVCVCVFANISSFVAGQGQGNLTPISGLANIQCGAGTERA